MSPLYDFGCDECGSEKEVVQRFAEEPPVCCGRPMHWLPTCPAKIDIKDKGGTRAYSKGYKEGYAKDYRRRLQESQEAKS